MKKHVLKVSFAVVSMLALLICLGSSLILVSAEAVEIPAPPMGQADLIKHSTTIAGEGEYTYTGGKFTSGAGASNGITTFNTQGLTADDTYVFKAKISQTSMAQATYGVYVIFRFNDANNYTSVCFRESGVFILGTDNGSSRDDFKQYGGAYTGYQLPNGPAEINIEIISGPTTVSVNINGEAAFTDVTVPKQNPRVGFRQEYSIFTATDLILYNTASAAIPANDGIPNMPVSGNLLSNSSAVSDPWGGSGAFSYADGVLKSVDNHTAHYTFKETGLTASDTYVFGADVAYSVSEAVGWRRPEIVLRSNDAEDYLAIAFLSDGVYLSGGEAGLELEKLYTDYFRGDTGKMRVDVISAPTAITVFVNGVKAFEKTGLTALTNAWVGARVYSGTHGEPSSMALSNMQLFRLPSYTLTASASAGGSISSPGESTVAFGDSKTYTITADEDYIIEDVKVDGVSKGNAGTYTFDKVIKDSTIEATFRLATDPFTITASKEGSGDIEPSGETQVIAGRSQKFSFAPETGHEVADVLVDGVSQGVLAEYTFTSVSKDSTIKVVFQPIPASYEITATAGANGAISPSGKVTVDRDGSQEFTFTPAAEFAVGEVLVDGAPVDLGGQNKYTFTGVRAAHTIAVSFVRAAQAPALPTGAVNLITNETATTGGTFENGLVTVKNGQELFFDGITGLSATDTYVFSARLFVESLGDVGWYGPRLYFRKTDNQNYLTFIFTQGGVSVYGPINGQDFGDWGQWKSLAYDRKAGDVIDVTIISEPTNVTVYVNGVKLIDRAEVAQLNPTVGIMATGAGDHIVADKLAVYKLTENVRIESTVTASAGEGGTIAPEGAVKVFNGANQTFTFTPKNGWEVDEVKVDGTAVAKADSYTFENVTADHTIAVTFKESEVEVPDGQPIQFKDLRGEDYGQYVLIPAEGEGPKTGFRIPMQMWAHQYYFQTDPEALPKKWHMSAKIDFHMVDEEFGWNGLRFLIKEKDYNNNFAVMWSLDGTLYPYGMDDEQYTDFDEELGVANVGKIEEESSYLVEISCDGDEYTFFVNGKQALKFTMPEEYRDWKTSIGIQQVFTSFTFSDIQIKTGVRPAGNTPDPGPGSTTNPDPGPDPSDNTNPGDVNTGVALPAGILAAAALSGSLAVTAKRRRRQK